MNILIEFLNADEYLSIDANDSNLVRVFCSPYEPGDGNLNITVIDPKNGTMRYEFTGGHSLIGGTAYELYKDLLAKSGRFLLCKNGRGYLWRVTE